MKITGGERGGEEVGVERAGEVDLRVGRTREERKEMVSSNERKQRGRSRRFTGRTTVSR